MIGCGVISPRLWQKGCDKEDRRFFFLSFSEVRWGQISRWTTNLRPHVSILMLLTTIRDNTVAQQAEERKKTTKNLFSGCVPLTPPPPDHVSYVTVPPFKTGAVHRGRRDSTVRTLSTCTFSAVSHLPMCNVHLKKMNVNLYCFKLLQSRCTMYIEVYNKPLYRVNYMEVFF